MAKFIGVKMIEAVPKIKFGKVLDLFFNGLNMD